MDRETKRILNMRKAKIKRHKSLKKLLTLLYECDLNELKSCTMFCTDFSTKHGDTNFMANLNFEQYIASIERDGIYGFADIPANTVHYWMHKDCDDSAVVHFFAHEFAHIALSSKKRQTNREQLDEEIYCERVAHISTHAIATAMNIFSRLRDRLDDTRA